LRVEFGLAVEAAVGCVLQVLGLRQLVGAECDVANADGGGDSLGGLEFAGGEAGADAGDGDGSIAESELRGLRDDGAVDAAGVGDDAAFKRSDEGDQRFRLL
jgi:hypothetical protein